MTKDRLRKAAERYRVTSSKHFRLKHCDPGDTDGIDLDKDDAETLLQEGVQRLAELQGRMIAQDRWAVLVIFQAMDAAGKDGAIKHVFSGLNPQGCDVTSFKQPSSTELDHDFLWRHIVHLPQRGRIGIHNRSWYEEVLVARVHPEILAKQKLPTPLVGDDIWDDRLADIAAFEKYLARQGTVVLKFFLNVSKDEQRARFLSRIEEPDKSWKFSADDLAERQHWKEYHRAYEAAIAATATKSAPWYVVPADHKWFTRLMVAEILIETLKSLDLQYPEVTAEQRAILQQAREKLD